ncbi:bifunctional diguanylate cyclase/phosphodiesterase [Sulfurimonas sp.]|uniref:bifunctional diguanylate cyclase/phosphodiesterase n=1 Tax=Sulfurimonas sp. TaxID=2022749 RepID=UPI0025D10EA3|nr:bifunctional diguanylate cyclase/phosphodiesterase [Sulfurimonas sp.]MDD5157767.1 bifunctional diguanylate cyclase/phosphodiesterase [Sulfurimonas sp.]
MIQTKLLTKKSIIIGTTILFLVFLLASLYVSTIKLQQNLEKKIFETSTNDTTSIARNISKEIYRLTAQYGAREVIQNIKSNTALQKEIEEKLSLFLTKDIKYAYLLYRDRKGIFRFLADASKQSEKAFIDQKFDIDSVLWNKPFNTKEPIFLENRVSKELSVTYLVPIVHKNIVSMILVVDFSIKRVDDIEDIMKKIRYGILLLALAILGFAIFALFQALRYQRSKKDVYIDRLTKIYNKNYLLDYEPYMNLHDYIICAIDIDHFKKINDTYGHAAGDRVLERLASVMFIETRKNRDILIRYGGEEFCLLIKKERESDAVGLNLLDRIFTKVAQEVFEISEYERIGVTISIGVNLNPENQRDFTTAFKLADIALYNAKNGGRNRIEIYAESIEDSSFLTINEIKDAIYDGRLMCLFQPIVDTKTQKVVHHEALVRIRAKDGTIITPDKFLSVTKGTFIARNLTKEVLDICYKKLFLDKSLSLSVNLNPQDLTSETILEILKMYAKIDTFSQRLGLEILESEEIVNYEEAQQNILMLKSLGYQIYIDDFGSGYSNFIYLAQINADVIKIDGSIIKNILTDKLSYLVAKNIISFAKEANIKTIAEFVSSKEIYEALRGLGVDKCQGYYFSSPKEL